jgi:hypothetical protein
MKKVMCVDFEATTTREAIAARENNATTSAAIEAHMISTTTVAVTATNTAALTLNRRHLEKYIRIAASFTAEFSRTSSRLSRT